MVTFPKDGKEGVAVGHQAVERAGRNPSLTVRTAKRFIGKEFDDPVVRKALNGLWFKAEKCPKKIKLPASSGVVELDTFQGQVCVSKKSTGPPLFPFLSPALISYPR